MLTTVESGGGNRVRLVMSIGLLEGEKEEGKYEQKRDQQERRVSFGRSKMKTTVNAYTQIIYSHPDLRRLRHRNHTNQGKSVHFEKGK